MAWLILGLCLFLTFWAWKFTREAVDRRAQIQFDLRVDQLKLLIHTRLLAQEQVLKSGVGLFAASQKVTESEWRRFFETLDLSRNYPGILGFGYAIRFRPEAKDSLEQAIRSQGHAGFSVTPPGLRPEMTSIIYLEPFKGRNLRAFGFDMFSETTRRAAMERARDSGIPSLSGRVTLVQESEQDPAQQAGFLIYLPVYRKDAPLETIDQRREALQGYVYSPFRMGDFMQALLPPSTWNLDFRIYDGNSTDPGSLMHVSAYDAGEKRRARFQKQLTLDLQGHQWTLQASSPPGFPFTSDRRQPEILLACGIALSLLLFGVAATLASTRMKARRLAEEMTRELRTLGESLEARVHERTRELHDALAAIRDSEERLRQSQKMEAVGRLAGGIAHDFNNLLTAINGYAALGLAQVEANHPLHENLEEIRKAGARAADLTMRLLAYSRKQILAPRVVNLNAVVSDLDRMLRRLLGADVAMETRLDEEVGWIKVDPGQIQQVIINLALNARDAMPHGGRLRISTRRDVLTRPDPRGKVGEDARGKDTAVPPGVYAVLAVEDSGTGMDAATLDRLFEPYFTTKPAGKGTGLGLSTVFGIVHQSGGHIQVFSAPGEGTVFRILLPEVKPEMQEQKAVSEEPDGGAAGRTILVAEDEPVVGTLLLSILEKSGYRVLLGRNGEEALAIARNHAGRIHLLLTDVVMSPMGGRELAERFQAEFPGTPVVFMSGYSDDSILKQEIRDNAGSFLQKPFSPEEVIRAIHKQLRSRGTPHTGA